MDPITIVLIILFILGVASFIGLVSSIYMGIRNNWVAKNRRILLNETLYTTDFTEYENYLSYKEMMNKFWVWDINKLKKTR